MVGFHCVEEKDRCFNWRLSIWQRSIKSPESERILEPLGALSLEESNGLCSMGLETVNEFSRRRCHVYRNLWLVALLGAILLSGGRPSDYKRCAILLDRAGSDKLLVRRFNTE